jgi:predicted peptidase
MKRLIAQALAAVVLAVGISAMSGCNGASDRALKMVDSTGDRGFMFKKITRGDHTRKYGLFIPMNYKPSEKYPVIVFLQGIGEGAGLGEGDGKNLTVGLGPFVAEQRDRFPFICIFPQSSGGWDANSVYAEDVISALDDVSKSYSVDQDRVSLTGLSTGGYGTYVIAAKYKNRFAAIVPMGSNGSAISAAENLTKTAVRAYCSAGGDIFAGDNDKRMVERIKSLGGNAEFIATDSFGHDCWDTVYGSGELFTWLLQQRRHPSYRTSTSGSAMPVNSTPTLATPVKTNAGSVINTSY